MDFVSEPVQTDATLMELYDQTNDGNLVARCIAASVKVALTVATEKEGDLDLDGNPIQFRNARRALAANVIETPEMWGRKFVPAVAVSLASVPQGNFTDDEIEGAIAGTWNLMARV